MSLRSELPKSLADFDGAGRICGDAPDPVLDRMHCLPCHETERAEDLYGVIPIADIPAELQSKVKTWRCYVDSDHVRKGSGGLPASKFDVDVRPARVLDDRNKERVELAASIEPPDGYMSDCDCPMCREHRYQSAHPRTPDNAPLLGGLPS